MAYLPSYPSPPMAPRLVTTPPTSPTSNSKRPAPAACAPTFGTITPPDTPTRSDSLTSMHIAVRESTSLTEEQQHIEQKVTKDGILEFRADSTDYVVLKDKKLGAGRFSQVYLAQSTKVEVPAARKKSTPSATPTKSQYFDHRSNGLPSVYAVKMAVDKPSLKAMKGEARILTHLCVHPESREYIVPFYGFDPRRGSLVFAALPATLADLITQELESLDQFTRATKLSAVLPNVARSLVAGLAWMHSLNVVHADIKPPNILLRPYALTPLPLRCDQSMLNMSFTPIFADFTSSFIKSDDPKTISSAGGGTYDYMAPEQLSPPFPPPDMKMDVYALAVSLLEVMTGRSPFQDAGSNRHMKIAMIKEGSAFTWAMRDARNEARFDATTQILLKRNAFDVKASLERGLRKNPNDRLTAAQWSQMW